MAYAALSARGRQVLHSVYWLSKRGSPCARTELAAAQLETAGKTGKKAGICKSQV